jgi:hypothetical protein
LIGLLDWDTMIRQVNLEYDAYDSWNAYYFDPDKREVVYFTLEDVGASERDEGGILYSKS